MSDQTTSTEPQLPPKKRGRGGLIAVVAAVVVLLALGVWALVATLGDDDAEGAGQNGGQDGTAGEDGGRQDRAGGDGEVVRIGTTDIAQPHWEILSDLAAEEGIEIEWVGFSEYTQPNPALAQGELDLNSFQHIQYLADHNNNPGDDLQPIGATIIVPLPLYSEQYDSVEDFQEGDEVAIPDDFTNQARALFVLESAGLISFTGDPALPSPDDVDPDASVVEVVPVEASQTAGLINELAGVVVNNNFATDAGFDLDDYVYADDPDDPGAQPYINVFASRAEDVDNPVYQRIVELYHHPDVAEAAVEASGGTAIVVEGFTGEDLREILADTEQTLLDAED